MSLAQRLYEGVELGEEGSVALITYMRTDSVHVSSDALAQVREMIPQRFGASYLPEKPNFYKSKKDAQEAHEAVRPTDVMRAPEDVRRYPSDDDLFKLYQLIWQRFVASQMLPAVFDQTTIDISAGDYTFRASGSVQKFDGFLRVYQMPASNADREDDEKEDEGEGGVLPRVSEGQTLRLDRIRPDQHFTEPPPRYNDATLVKELEEKGIGRPSTYASIISTIVEREYVTKNQGRFSPTMLGERVSVLLVKSFEDIFDVTFTARLEEELDEIEEGKLPWREAVKEFWEKFVVDLDKADDEMLSYKAGIPTGKKCEKCGQGELLERISRHGFFLGCSRYPECDFIQDLSPELPEDDGSDRRSQYCDNCGKEMVIKRGRFGIFLACKGYPECKTTRRLVRRHASGAAAGRAAGRKVPDCGAQLVQAARAIRRVRRLLGVPQVQVHPREDAGHRVPEMRHGRVARAHGQEGPPPRLLRLQSLSGMRFHHALPADRRALPEMRRAIHRGKAQQGRRDTRLPERRLRLGNGRPGVAGGAGGRARRSRGLGQDVGRRNGDRSGIGGTGWGRQAMKGAIEKFLGYLRSVRNASPLTICGYETDLAQFLEYLSPPDSEPLAPAQIDHRMIREFLGHLHDQQLQKSSMARKLATLRSFFKFCAREGLVRDNPARLVATPKLPKRLPDGAQRRGDERLPRSTRQGRERAPGSGGASTRGKAKPRRGCCSRATAPSSNCSTPPACASAS